MPHNRRFLPAQDFQTKIYLIRNKRVMLDRDLAELYGVTTKVFNQSVKRNIARFPEDFMFQLSKSELENWRSQFVTSNLSVKMGIRYNPYAFTEQGIAMLSGVLHSPRAIQANIQIMRSFVKLREMIATNDLIRQKIEELERKFDKHEKQFKVIFDAIRDLLEPTPPPEKKPIGFHVRYH